MVAVVGRRIIAAVFEPLGDLLGDVAAEHVGERRKAISVLPGAVRDCGVLCGLAAVTPFFAVAGRLGDGADILAQIGSVIAAARQKSADDQRCLMARAFGRPVAREQGAGADEANFFDESIAVDDDCRLMELYMRGKLLVQSRNNA